jgi:hypothetical protein
MKSISLARCVSLATLLVALIGNVIKAEVGATVPFTTYEGEAGTVDGGATVVSLTSPPSDKFSSPLLEASGRAYVQLAGTGQSVTWTNKSTTAYTAMNVRICIPDSPDGTGQDATLDLYVNGVFRQAVNLSSKQAWDYGNGKGSQNPADGGAYNFYEESHFFITGNPIVPGSTFALKQDTANTAAFYYVDCVDLETPPAPLPQPDNSLSIVDSGAVANNPSIDSTPAIQQCVMAAAAAGKSVWVPPGIFYMNSGAIHETNVTITGAGMWYSEVYHHIPTVDHGDSVFRGLGGTIQNLAVDGNASSRHVYDGGGLNMDGTNWVVNSVWVEHTSSGVWGKGTSGLVENSRFTHSWADGINLNQGNTPTGVGVNLTARNNFTRGCGDDGLAVNSQGPGAQLENIQFINNTSLVVLNGAHCLAAYGGDKLVLQDNLLCDPVKAPALVISHFGAKGYQVSNAVVTGNTVVRGGAYAKYNSGALVINSSPSHLTIGSNTVDHSLFSGIEINGNVTDATFTGNVVTSPGLTGILIDSTSKGDATFDHNIVTGLNTGQEAFLNNSTNFVTTPQAPSSN